ncbi:hypothetical protein GYMLUDRAFT_44122, partial [Collybiopsis luxurians FD-317 M1]
QRAIYAKRSISFTPSTRSDALFVVLVFFQLFIKTTPHSLSQHRDTPYNNPKVVSISISNPIPSS